ncbi:MAG: hypothetical protein Q8P67_22010 [archaeon]|nr:hypothetical protein [archaeon]
MRRNLRSTRSPGGASAEELARLNASPEATISRGLRTRNSRSAAPSPPVAGRNLRTARRAGQRDDSVEPLSPLVPSSSSSSSSSSSASTTPRQPSRRQPGARAVKRTTPGSASGSPAFQNVKIRTRQSIRAEQSDEDSLSDADEDNHEAHFAAHELDDDVDDDNGNTEADNAEDNESSESDDGSDDEVDNLYSRQAAKKKRVASSKTQQNPSSSSSSSARSSLFEGIRGANRKVGAVNKVIGEWTRSYREDQQRGVYELVVLLLACAGFCPPRELQEPQCLSLAKFSTLDSATKAERFVATVLAKHQKAASCQLLVSHAAKGEALSEAQFGGFWGELFRKIGGTVLHDGVFLESLLCWVTSLSCSEVLAFRQAATMAGYEILASLLVQRGEVASKAEHFRIQKTKASLQTAQAQMEALDERIQELFADLFGNRYRDHDAKVRALSISAYGKWLEIVPKWSAKDSAAFLAPESTRKLGWALNDRNATVRMAAVRVLQKVFDVQGNRTQLRTFLDTFVVRLYELPYDKDNGVAIEALYLLSQLARFSPAHVDQGRNEDIYKLTVDAHAGVRAEAAQFAHVSFFLPALKDLPKSESHDHVLLQQLLRFLIEHCSGDHQDTYTHAIDAFWLLADDQNTRSLAKTLRNLPALVQLLVSDESSLSDHYQLLLAKVAVYILRKQESINHSNSASASSSPVVLPLLRRPKRSFKHASQAKKKPQVSRDQIAVLLQKLPELLERYQSYPEILQVLVEVPSIVDLDHVSPAAKVTKKIVESLADCFLKQSSPSFLNECAKSFGHLRASQHTARCAEEQFEMLLQQLRTGYEHALEEFQNQLLEDHDDLQGADMRLTGMLARMDVLMSSHDLRSWGTTTSHVSRDAVEAALFNEVLLPVEKHIICPPSLVSHALNWTAKCLMWRVAQIRDPSPSASSSSFSSSSSLSSATDDRSQSERELDSRRALLAPLLVDLLSSDRQQLRSLAFRWLCDLSVVFSKTFHPHHALHAFSSDIQAATAQYFSETAQALIVQSEQEESGDDDDEAGGQPDATDLELAALVQEFTLPVLFGALPKKNLLPVLMLFPTELPETNSLIADTLGRVRAADPARECDLVLALLRHCFEAFRAMPAKPSKQQQQQFQHALQCTSFVIDGYPPCQQLKGPLQKSFSRVLIESLNSALSCAPDHFYQLQFLTPFLSKLTPGVADRLLSKIVDPFLELFQLNSRDKTHQMLSSFVDSLRAIQTHPAASSGATPQKSATPKKLPTALKSPSSVSKKKRAVELVPRRASQRLSTRLTSAQIEELLSDDDYLDDDDVDDIEDLDHQGLQDGGSDASESEPSSPIKRRRRR